MRFAWVLGFVAAFSLVGCQCDGVATQTDGSAGGDGTTGGGSGGSTGGGAGGGSVGGGGGGDVDAGPVDAGCGLVTCRSAGVGCGLIGDGCSSVIDCGACPAPQTCGGGGVASQCGGDGGCVPRTCQQVGASCGPMSDGCGRIMNCGACTGADVCGGGGVPGQCGTPTGAGDAGCTPRTCAQLGASCGVQGDGCGGLTASCGTCAAPASCGGGGVANQCGTSPCVPRSCGAAMASCGQVGDGCGGLTASCGTCTAPLTCGGGGTSNACGQPTGCVPRTCAQLGATCGIQGDGCGGLTANCGTCTAPDICGGSGVPNQCGHASADAGTACVNLCTHQTSCPGGGTTTLTGTVRAPTDPAAGYGNPDPLPGALVYVPNDVVQGFPAGVSCDQCSATVTGSPLVHTTTAVDGTFTLSNVPCGVPVPVVIQLGRWRRQITVPAVTCCASTALTADQTRLPRRQAEGSPNDNIPLIAVVTGDVDTIECVLPKIGIAMTEYSLPSGTGRVRFYVDNGADFTGGAPAATALFDSLAEMQKYDMIVLDCVGSEVPKTATERANLEAYANAGGRVFASHFSYVWLYGTPTPNSFTATATWNVGQNSPPNQDAYIDTTFAKGQLFGQWVYTVGVQAASSTPAVPKIRVNTVRHDFDAVIPPAERWVYGTANGNAISGGNPAIPLQYAFNTPTSSPPANQCGRVLFSDFHVINANGAGGQTWPGQCTVGPMTPQEKVFEYLIFDLSSCVTPAIAVCTPKTCQQLGAQCGMQGDGCGGLTTNCGTCPAPQTCGGGGVPGVCGAGCTPRTCAQLGFNCGQQADGCGGVIGCGTCTAPQTCGGGGTPGVCGGTGCVPKTCTQLGFTCGPQSDGCGNVIPCGTCPAGQSCGAQAPGQCGAISCAPLTCAQQGLACGPAGDGCGNVIQCGSCVPPDTCGGSGTQGVCGHSGCTPIASCAQVNPAFNCGPLADGCGGTIDCGTCTAPATCGGGGTANVCGSIG